MRIEFRSSGGRTCNECGATELLSVASTAEKIEADLWEVLKPRLEEFQYVVLQKDKRNFRELLDQGALVTEEELDETIGEIFRKHAPRFRLYRRKWLSRVQEDIEGTVQDLRKQTLKL